MASIRRTKTGKWQATVHLPDGKGRSRTRITWSPAEVVILVPQGLLAMDVGAKLERTFTRVLREMED